MSDYTFGSQTFSAQRINFQTAAFNHEVLVLGRERKDFSVHVDEPIDNQITRLEEKYILVYRKELPLYYLANELDHGLGCPCLGCPLRHPDTTYQEWRTPTCRVSQLNAVTETLIEASVAANAIKYPLFVALLAQKDEIYTYMEMFDRLQVRVEGADSGLHFLNELIEEISLFENPPLRRILERILLRLMTSFQFRINRYKNSNNYKTFVSMLAL